jgi:hypothetical protein
MARVATFWVHSGKICQKRCERRVAKHLFHELSLESDRGVKESLRNHLGSKNSCGPSMGLLPIARGDPEMRQDWGYGVSEQWVFNELGFNFVIMPSFEIA